MRWFLMFWRIILLLYVYEHLPYSPSSIASGYRSCELLRIEDGVPRIKHSNGRYLAYKENGVPRW